MSAKGVAAPAGGMTDAEFDAALSQIAQQKGGGAAAAGMAAPQDQSLWRYPKLAMNALVGGADYTLGLPGELSSLVNRGATAAVDAATGAKFPVVLAPGGPTGPQLMQITNSLGLTNRPEAIPSTPAERIGTAALEGAVPGLLGGPAGAIAGALGGAAGEAVHEGEPDNSWLPPIVGGVVGLGAGAFAGIARNALLGRSLRRGVSLAEDNLANAKQTADAAADTRRFAPRERAALVAQHNEGVDNQIDDMAQQLGLSRTPQDAGNALQEWGRNWEDNVFPAKAQMLRSPLLAAVPADAETDLSPMKAALESISQKAGKLQTVAGAVRRPTAGILLSRLKALGGEEELETGEEAGLPTASFADAMALRSEIGEAMADPSLANGLGQKDLSAAYAGLTKALGTVAADHGAEDIWQTYNKGMEQLYKFRSGPLAKIISTGREGQETVSPAQAYSAALSRSGKGGTVLEQLRAEMPEGVNELAASVLRTPGEWSKLSPEAKSALLPGPQASTVDQLLGSKLTKSGAAEADKIKLDDLAYATGKSLDAAKERLANARAALAKHETAGNQLTQELAYKLLSAGVGYNAMKGSGVANELLGAAAGYALPGAARALQRGVAGAFGRQQLALPAAGAYGGYTAEGIPGESSQQQ